MMGRVWCVWVWVFGASQVNQVRKVPAVTGGAVCDDVALFICLPAA